MNGISLHHSTRLLSGISFVLFYVLLMAFSQDKRIVPLGSGGRKVALVIGNSSYSVGSLTNPVKDAAAMRKALRAKGFLVSDCCDNLGIQKMTSTINDWTRNLQKDDVALFYYSGHGIRVDSTDYLVPSDYSSSNTLADVPYSAYSVDRLQEKMQERGTRTNVIILDACRDNPFITSKSLGKGLAGTAAGFGTFIMYAASPGKTASDNSTSDNSLFTKVLLQSLNQESVRLKSLANDVKDRVYDLSGGTQIPYISENMVGDLQLGVASSSAEGSPSPSEQSKSGQSSIHVISGRVINKETKEGILGCVVRLRRTGEGVATDEMGDFSFATKSPLSPGEAVDLQVGRMGYEPVNETITSTEDLKVELTPSVQSPSSPACTQYDHGLRHIYWYYIYALAGHTRNDVYQQSPTQWLTCNEEGHVVPLRVIDAHATVNGNDGIICQTDDNSRIFIPDIKPQGLASKLLWYQHPPDEKWLGLGKFCEVDKENPSGCPTQYW